MSPFKLRKFNNFLSSKNATDLSIWIIEIISPKLSLKTILVLLILIFLSENFLLLNTLNNLRSLLNNEKLASLITNFLISIFSLSKKFPWSKNTLKFLISAIYFFSSPSSTKILESLIKKCGAGRMR